jgi:murein hydrolase activator
MKVRGPFRAAAGALLMLLVTATTAAARAQEPIDREITESQRRLEQIRQERADLREEMTRIRSRVSDLSSELSNLDRQVGTVSGLITELEFQVAQRELQMGRNTRDLLDARDRLAERQAVLHRRLRDIYKRGQVQTLEVLLGAESFSDLLYRYRYLFLVARHDRRLAEEVIELERQLLARERALRANVAQLERVRLERSTEHGQLTGLQDQQRRALSSVRSRETATAQRIGQLERDETRIADLLATLEAERRAAEEAERRLAAPGGPGLAEAGSIGRARMGSLDWPVEGRLLYRFGRVTQPNGTVIRRNGVGIAAPAGSPVRAVEWGNVVHAAPFEGYGPTVILSHGGGYYTLYLFLRELRVRMGETVQLGQTIGTVGGETTSEGAHLEFQLRIPGGEADDPLAWLRRR